MRRFSVQLAILCSVALSSATLPAPASAVAPQRLGQTAVPGKEKGGCNCTLVQLGDVGPSGSSYMIPYDGVIVRSGLYIGEMIGVGDTVKVQTVDPTGAMSGTVVSEGTAHALVGSTTETVRSFYERVPARMGDVLAARFNDGPCLCVTPAWFETTSEGDKALQAPQLTAGGSFSVSPVGKSRLNLEAVLEPDEDKDGYGDTSQDLCLGSPIGAAACSGTLFGSNLQGEGSPPPLSCGGGGCIKVQKTLNGASTAASFDGVVVRWRVLNGESGSYRARVMVPNPAATGGLFTGFTVLHSSAAESVTESVPPFSKISTFQTRLPIPAGGYVGLKVPSLADQGFQASGGAATFVETNDGGDGITVSGQSHNGAVLYDADIEPDVDGDGYGDVSQDSCPSSASVHEGSCPPSPPTPIPAARSQITGFKAVPKSFRVKPGGAVVSSRKAGPQGTKLQLTLSTAAKVSFAIEGKLVCKPAKKAAHHCKPGFRKVHAFSRSLPRGASSVPYSGRYKRAGKVQSLKPGSYRATAVASNAAGSGGSAQTAFTVLR